MGRGSCKTAVVASLTEHPGPLPHDLVAAVDVALGPVLTLASSAAADTISRVSASQLEALLHLSAKGSTNLTGLAEALDVRPSSATRLCERMIAADLISKRSGTEDRREVVIALTPTGAQVVLRIEARRRAALARALSGLSDKERRALLSGLTALGHVIDQLADADRPVSGQGHAAG